MTPSDERALTRWTYRQTWARDDGSDDDAATIKKHLDDWAEAGWELVSANAVQHLLIDTLPASSHFTSASTYSTSMMRHYYYWRKPVSGAAPQQADASGAESTGDKIESADPPGPTSRWGSSH